MCKFEDVYICVLMFLGYVYIKVFICWSFFNNQYVPAVVLGCMYDEGKMKRTWENDVPYLVQLLGSKVFDVWFGPCVSHAREERGFDSIFGGCR